MCGCPAEIERVQDWDRYQWCHCLPLVRAQFHHRDEHSTVGLIWQPRWVLVSKWRSSTSRRGRARTSALLGHGSPNHSLFRTGFSVRCESRGTRTFRRCETAMRSTAGKHRDQRFDAMIQGKSRYAVVLPVRIRAVAPRQPGSLPRGVPTATAEDRRTS
jgi:hypothetical protein